MHADSVWINFILADENDKMMNGWYKYNKERHKFVSEIDESFSCSAALYGKTFMAFRNPVEIKEASI